MKLLKLKDGDYVPLEEYQKLQQKFDELLAKCESAASWLDEPTNHLPHYVLEQHKKLQAAISKAKGEASNV